MIGGAKGIGIGLDFGIGNIKRPTKKGYLDPSVKEALCGIWIADQNTNDSPTRNIIKNKIKDAGGDFEILNAAYKLNSGYGKYKVDFTKLYSLTTTALTSHSFVIPITNDTRWLLAITPAISTETYKVKVSGLSKGDIITFVNNTDGNITIDKDGIYTLPKVEQHESSQLHGFLGATTITAPIYIEQIPDYQGAFVTDGVDDLIVSQKPVSEMLGGSNELTVVSMIHQIGLIQVYGLALNNYIRNNGGYLRNSVNSVGKTGIYGYTANNLNQSIKDRVKVINTILGDKKDYNASISDSYVLDDSLFHVQNYIHDGIIAGDGSRLAWYWTLIAKRVLTTDEINQVIAYYNLDKYVAPDVYYDVKKQGLTNENHAEFGDKLIDYSGNGKDMQLYNFGWKLDSGVGKYEEDFTSWGKNATLNSTNSMITINDVSDFNPSNWILWKTAKGSNSFKVRIKGLPENSKLIYVYRVGENSNSNIIEFKEDGIYELPASNTISNGQGFKLKDNYELVNHIGLTIEQLPSYENSVVFDGVEDYGQYVGDLGLKDYTVVADRAYVELNSSQIPITSQVNKNELDTPFTFEALLNGSNTSTTAYSFGNKNDVLLAYNRDRKTSYQSKYVYNSKAITAGNGNSTGNGLTFGCNGTKQQYAKLCLYNFMLFPYSLSEFLIERQLKKRKIGTLYPNMVAFRPVVKGNVPFDIVKYETVSEEGVHSTLEIGQYIPIGQEVCISIRLSDSLSKISSVQSYSLTNIIFGMPPSGTYGSVYGKVTSKSPQKINIHIDEYILFEDIGQTYPIAVDIYNAETDYKYTYGDKLLIGSPIKLKVVNLLPELYSSPRNKFYRFDDNLGLIIREDTTYYVGKNMSFTGNGKYLFGDNKPKVIYSPEKYPISNEGLKILGYLPDLSGNRNHGKLNNFFFTGNYDVITNGAIQFGKTNNGGYTHITIPTVKNGCKQMMAKIKWAIKDNISSSYIYDHSGSISKVGKSTYIRENANEDIAYFGTIKTYLDGKLNTYIKAKTLAGVTHNITSILNSDSAAEIYIGKNGKDVMSTDELKGGIYSLMLFDEIDNDETIMKLNEAIGIENNQQGGVEPVVDFTTFQIVRNPVLDVSPTTIHVTNIKESNFFMDVASTTLVIPSFKIRVTGVAKGRGVAYHYCKADGTFNMYWCEVDGEHTLPESIHSQSQQHTGFRTNFTGDCDILIEQIV